MTSLKVEDCVNCLAYVNVGDMVSASPFEESRAMLRVPTQPSQVMISCSVGKLPLQ